LTTREREGGIGHASLVIGQLDGFFGMEPMPAGGA